jgi:hypothetical protein
MSLNDSQEDDKKKDSSNGWDKIPEVIQIMIIKLSLTNDENFPTCPHTAYLQVSKQSKTLGVAMVLNVVLSAMGCQVEITTSMASTIRQETRANILQTVHLFSIFNVPYLYAANISNFKKIDLLQFEGEGIPKVIVKKLLENRLQSQSNNHLLRH